MSSLPPIFYEIPRNPVLAVGLPVTLGFATGFLTKNSEYGPDSLWYKSLKKAEYDPPKWSFGVVWPALYATMGYTSYLTVRALDRTPPGLGRDNAKLAVGLYYAQLALNQIWTPLHFGYGHLGLALVDLVALTGTAIYWRNTLTKVDSTAAALTLPYIGWLSFATYLNGTLWYNNKGKDQLRSLKKDAQNLGDEARDFAKDAKANAKDLKNEAKSAGQDLKQDAKRELNK